MKLTLTASLLALLASPAFADGPAPGTTDPCVFGDDCSRRFGYTPPETVWPDCDRPAIVNAACDDKRRDPEPEKPEQPEKPEKPEQPDCKSGGCGEKPGKPQKNGNASANNGKGGNYDKTGHSDNGKGNGRGRQ